VLGADSERTRATAQEETVEIRGVTLLRKTPFVLLCQIGNREHWIAPSRLMPGSTLRHPGDVGLIVVARDFAVERGLLQARGFTPSRADRTPRCESPRSDGAPCAAPRRTGSSFCFAHDRATVTERDASQALGVANARQARAERREKRKG